MLIQYTMLSRLNIMEFNKRALNTILQSMRNNVISCKQNALTTSISLANKTILSASLPTTRIRMTRT